jgi:hypothetical protein
MTRRTTKPDMTRLTSCVSCLGLGADPSQHDMAHLLVGLGYG